MNAEHFVCIWERSDFDYDSEGESYNTSDYYNFTIHDTLEQAQDLAAKGNIGYARHKNIVSNQEQEDNFIEPIYVPSIFVYENKKMVGLYNTCDFDGWRYYEKQPHWNDMYSDWVTLPYNGYSENRMGK